jgi:hypothetical protein
MWRVALKCHAGGDILLIFHLFSCYQEVVQNDSQPTLAEFVCYWGWGGGPSINSNTLCTKFQRHVGVCISVLNNYVPLYDNKVIMTSNTTFFCKGLLFTKQQRHVSVTIFHHHQVVLPYLSDIYTCDLFVVFT